MATLGYSWTTIKSGSFSSGGATLTYYIEAKLAGQSTTNNQSEISTRARTVFTGEVMGGSGYSMSCTGCTTDSGSGVIYYNNPSYTNSYPRVYHTYDKTRITGSITVDHNSDGTKTFSMSGACTNTYLGMNISISGSIDLPKIPRYSTITSFSAFTIEDGFSFGYKDELANKTLTLTCTVGNTNILTKTYTSSVGSHTDSITFTSSQLSTIYSALGASAKSATFALTLATSGITSTSSSTATGTLKTSVNQPTLSGGTMAETQLTAYGVAATEIIRYLSKKQVSVTATARNGATISSVKIKNGTSAETNMALSNGVYSKLLSNLQSDTFIITATDSRGLTATTTLTGTLKEYSYPAVTKVEFDRDSAVVSSGYLNPSGTYWNGTAGNTTNTITWKYKLNGGSDISGTTANLTKTDNTWSDELDLASGTLDRETTYECIVTVTDAFNQSATYTVNLGIAQLALWLGKYTVKADGIVGNHFIGVFPVGAIYLSVDNTNPSTYFGGTWERIAQGRALIGAGSIEANNHNLRGTVTAGEFTPTGGQMGGEVNHQLITGELPAHNHTVNKNVEFTVSNTSPAGTGTSGIYGGNSGWGSYGPADWYKPTTANTGSDTAHNNIMPYLAIYVWQRTA